MFRFKSIVSLVVAIVIATTASAQTVLSRVDVNKWGNPSLTTAFFTKDGWEVWVFGANRSDTQDLELGHLYPLGKKWLAGGYGVIWPDSGKVFGLPFVMYRDSVVGGSLTLKIGSYLPLNGGPRILFSDESSLKWRAGKGVSWGPVFSYGQVNGGKPTEKLGLSINLTRGGTDLELSCQSVYLGENRGAPHFRFQISQKL